MSDKNAVNAKISGEGMHIRINTEVESVKKALTESVTHLKASKEHDVKHYATGEQPIDHMLALLVEGEIFLPLRYFYVPSPNDNRACATLGENYHGFTKRILEKFKLEWQSSIHHCSALTTDHILFICCTLYDYVHRDMKMITVQNTAGQFDTTKSEELGLQIRAEKGDIDYEFDYENFVAHGSYLDKGTKHHKYPQAYQMVGDCRGRKGFLVDVPAAQMAAPRAEEAARKTSEQHIQDQIASLLTTASCGDAGEMAHNVVMHDGKRGWVTLH
jgi:hypothetical protein